MKFVIDDKQSLKHKLSSQEVFALLAIRGNDYDNVLENLVNRKILTRRNNKLYVTKEWSDIVDKILLDSQGSVNDEARLSVLAKKMRNCFPEGKMHGTAYYYRCNNREVILKLKKFFEQYGNYSDDDIIEATKRFVASFQGNYRFLPLIKYFISKNKLVTDEDGKSHVTEVSELASYLENLDNKVETQINSSDDWMMTARN